MRTKLSFIILVGSLTFAIRLTVPNGYSDLLQAVRPAQDFLLNRPALGWTTNALYVPSPLTITPLGLPFAALPSHLSSALFVGLSCSLLASRIYHKPLLWPLLISMPFFQNVVYSQYLPFVMALGLSGLAPVGLLIKPHVTLPLVLTQRTTKVGWLVTLGVVVWTLLAFGLWPLKWLSEIIPYTGMPIALSPIGFMTLAIALLSRQWLVALYCLVPTRGLYDLLPLFLVCRSWKESSALALVSWIMIPNSERVFVLCVALLHLYHHPRKVRGGEGWTGWKWVGQGSIVEYRLHPSMHSNICSRTKSQEM